ncbi:hypothetical protein D3C86_1438390 [compost metagenome]
MPARDQQQQEGIGRLRPQPRRHRVPLQMVDRDQRQAARQGHGLAVGQPHHDPADETRPGGRRHPVQGGVVDPGLGHGPARHPVDHLDMAAGGDFRHHPAEGRVLVDLTVNDAGQDLGSARRQAHHRGGGLVAAGLQTQNRQPGAGGAAFGPSARGAQLGCPRGPAAIVRASVHRVEVAARFPFRNGCATS